MARGRTSGRILFRGPHAESVASTTVSERCVLCHAVRLPDTIGRNSPITEVRAMNRSSDRSDDVLAVRLPRQHRSREAWDRILDAGVSIV